MKENERGKMGEEEWETGRHSGRMRVEYAQKIHTQKREKTNIE